MEQKRVTPERKYFHKNMQSSRFLFIFVSKI